MVSHWWRRRDRERGWQPRLAINSVGTLATGIVAVVVGVSKFALGAWVVLVLIPALLWIMWNICRHYRLLARAAFPETPLDPNAVHVRMIVPVADLGIPARQALAYAEALAPPGRVVAVHVAEDDTSAERFRARWQEELCQTPLVIIESPYRSLISPLLRYIDATQETHPDDTVTVVLPEYVPRRWWGASPAQPDGAAARGRAAVSPQCGGRERAVPPARHRARGGPQPGARRPVTREGP
jgi:hypothetical protein